jgi:type I restriction enzyme S subunit
MIKKIHTEDLPDSWELVPLGEFVENEKGKKPKQESKEKSPEFNLPYIDIQAFEEGIIKSWTNGEGCRLCHEDDFLMVWDGSRSGLVGKGVNGALGSTLVRINFPGIFNDYAYYFLQSKFAEINSRAKGVGIPHVDPNLLWNYGFPIPPLNEQKRIVAKIEELFSELDSGIQSLKTAREQLKIYRQAVLKHAFEGKLTAPWREKNKDKLESADQLLARIKREREEHYQQQLKEWAASVKAWEKNGAEGKKPTKPKGISPVTILADERTKKLPTLPFGWAWFDLASVASESILGKMLDKEKNKGELKPYLRNINVRWGEFDLSNLLEMRFEDSESERYSLKEGDLVICEGGEPGRCAIWKNEIPEIRIQKALHRVRVCDKIIKPEYLYYSIIFSNEVGLLRKYFTGTTIKHLTGEGLSNIEIPLCAPAEQDLIVKEIESIFSNIASLEGEIDTALNRTEALRQSILKKAFSGQLVAQDPADEPASVLLERIRNEKQKGKEKQPSKPKKRVA